MTTKSKVLTWACMLLAVVAWGEPQVKVEYKPTQVKASGITPGGEAVMFGVSHDGEWMDHFYHWRVTGADTDRDGTVSFEHDKGYPLRSMLLVIDLARGDYAVATAFPLEHELPPLDLAQARYGPSGAMVFFTQAGSRVDVLVARPGVGAWGASIADGGPLDADRACNGTVSIDFSRLRPVGTSPKPPDGVHPGDLLALADAGRLWLAAVRVAAPQGSR